MMEAGNNYNYQPQVTSTSAESNKTFAALKLIEKLYIDGDINETVFRNILRENTDKIDISCFKCYTKDINNKQS